MADPRSVASVAGRGGDLIEATRGQQSPGQQWPFFLAGHLQMEPEVSTIAAAEAGTEMGIGDTRQVCGAYSFECQELRAASRVPLRRAPNAPVSQGQPAAPTAGRIPR